MRTKATIALATGLLFLAASAIATERAVNLYKTHKLSVDTVMVTCNDGTEPTIQHSLSFAIITCKVAK